MFNSLARCKEPYKHTRDLLILIAIDDYNCFIGEWILLTNFKLDFQPNNKG